MLIPFGTDRPLKRPPIVTPVLIGINIVFFLGQQLLMRSNPEEYERLMRPLLVSGPDFKIWQLWTSAFLHADWWHVLGNMVVLWVFGPNVEDRFTRIGYVIFYLLGAAVSGGVHALLEKNPALGASGAVSAVTGAYMVLFPRTNIRCLVFIIIIGVFSIPAWCFITFAIAKDLVFAGAANDNVARFAHLGGYGYGIAVSLFLLWRRILDREPYDLFTMGRQAARRRQFKEAAITREKKEAKTGVRRGAADPGVEDSPAVRARAQVSSLMAKQEKEEAGMAYKQLVNTYADSPAMCTLSRRHQVEIADHFFGAGDYEAAAYAYERFLETYERDTEAPRVRLLLALINTRRLNDPVRARQLLTGLGPQLRDAEQRQLLETLLKELG